MFIVYTRNPDITPLSWDYQCTIGNYNEILYHLIELVEEYDGFCNQGKLLMSLINNKEYVGDCIIIYEVNPNGIRSV